MAQPYFQEMSALKWHEGKSFLANPKLFRADAALYFPNLRGRTLDGNKKADTTKALKGRVSVVSMFSSQWAEAQKNTFVSERENPQLHEILKTGGQKVEINIETNPARATILWLFEWNLRRQIPKTEHDRYFILQKGLTNEIRHRIGLLNSKVGYVYLLDEECRIRWAASGRAEGDERDYLNRGLSKLVEEAGTRPKRSQIDAAGNAVFEAESRP